MTATPTAATRERRNDLTRNAGHATSAVANLLNLNTRQHPCACPQRRRDIADIHALFGTTATSREAFATPTAALHVAFNRLGGQPHRVAGIAKEEIALTLHSIRGRGDPEEIRNRVKMRIKMRSIGPLEIEERCPAVENRIRRPHADRGIDERPAAEGDRLHGGHDRPACHSEPTLAHGSRHREVPVELEIANSERRPFFEQNHIMARRRQFIGRNRATRTRADDDDIRLLMDGPVVLREYPDALASPG